MTISKPPRKPTQSDRLPDLGEEIRAIPTFAKEGNPWGEWPDENEIDELLANAPRKLAKLEDEVSDLVHLEDVKSELSALFEAIAKLPPEERQKVEKFVTKLAKQPDKKPLKTSEPDTPHVAPEFYSKRADKREDIVGFVERVYGRYLDGCYFTLADLRRLDGSAASAVAQWRLHKTWPTHLKLPTLPEANALLIGEGRIEFLKSKLSELGFLTKEEVQELRRLEASKVKTAQRHEK